MPDADAEIRVEFYGLARRRTGTATIQIPATQSVTLQALWGQVLARFPKLESADASEALPPSVYRVNLDGHRFVTDPQTRIRTGQCVLIMSADAGG